MGELIMLRLEDRILETLLREALDGMVTKVSQVRSAEGQ